MDVIAIEDEVIDAEILDAMAVSQHHFDEALGLVNLSSLRETVVQVPDRSWTILADLKRPGRI